MSLRKARRPKEDTEKRREGKGGVGAQVSSLRQIGAQLYRSRQSVKQRLHLSRLQNQVEK